MWFRHADNQGFRQDDVQSSSPLGPSAATAAAVQQPMLPSHGSFAEVDAAAAISQAQTFPQPGSGRTEVHDSTAHLQTAKSSSSVTEAVMIASADISERDTDGQHSIAIEADQSSSAPAESAYAVSGLDAFLHTVTTADEVLNDLLGELSDSSSSPTPTAMSRQSSSSLADLTQADGTAVLENRASSASPSVSGLTHSFSELPAAEVIQLSAVLSAAEAIQSSSAEPAAESPRSSSPLSAAEAICSSSAEARSPRSTTEVVLDALLADLRSAELVRQSSSTVLLDSLTSLAQIHRQSSSSGSFDSLQQSSSSPRAGSSNHDMLRQQSSSSSPLPTDTAEPQQQHSSSPASSSMVETRTAGRQGSPADVGDPSASSAVILLKVAAQRSQQEASVPQQYSCSAGLPTSGPAARAALLSEEVQDQKASLGAVEPEEEEEQQAQGLKSFTADELVVRGILDGVRQADVSHAVTGQVMHAVLL